MRKYNFAYLHGGNQVTVGISMLASIFAPVRLLAIIVLVFILTDFVFGLIVSIRIKKKGFISTKAYNTIWKLIGAEVCILLSHLLDEYIFTFIPAMFLPNIITGFICGADLWSILTNCAILSNHPVFRAIKKWGRSEIERKTGIDISDLEKTVE